VLTVQVNGIPELLRELQRLSGAAQGRVARNMARAGARSWPSMAADTLWPQGCTGKASRRNWIARRRRLGIHERHGRRSPSVLATKLFDIREAAKKFRSEVVN
jgi:hypothetical protein